MSATAPPTKPLPNAATAAAALAPGKRQLLDAALRLCQDGRALSSLGLRELAREAGLNPNTFYRHFNDLDELGLCLLDEIAGQLRGPLSELRYAAAARSELDATPRPQLLGLDMGRGRQVVHETVNLFFDFVDRHPHAFMVGVRELHGPSPVLRDALQRMMDDFADDIRRDCRKLELLPEGLAEHQLEQLALLITHTLFRQALDYLMQPEQHTLIRALTEEHVLMLATGAAVLQHVDQLRLPVKPAKSRDQR
ncbi:TetR family transcriptional regulator [Atopomonas sediminilitoris]|uniref:TetR family transcriptional regulator n=1 Tax=Atopomonas sediminilitoris TaxID=2919919 RepID=UPI001F4DF427|nr:TetR family transcriptional regulator [Atopomonas sediminilitoris]MCJ8168146.1 TetR family transcriptional regulator [Atopomonas sediminilitoris]